MVELTQIVRVWFFSCFPPLCPIQWCGWSRWERHMMRQNHDLMFFPQKRAQEAPELKAMRIQRICSKSFTVCFPCGEGPPQGRNSQIPEGFAFSYAAKRGQQCPSSAAVQLKLFLLWKGARQNCHCLGLGCSHRSKLERSARASCFAILCFPEIPVSQQSWAMIYSFPGEMTLGFTGLGFWKIWWAWLAACCLSELSEGCGFWRKVKLLLWHRHISGNRRGSCAVRLKKSRFFHLRCSALVWKHRESGCIFSFLFFLWGVSFLFSFFSASLSLKMWCK